MSSFVADPTGVSLRVPISNFFSVDARDAFQRQKIGLFGQACKILTKIIIFMNLKIFLPK